MIIADIQTLARFLTNTDTTSFTYPNLLILVNHSYERIVGKLIVATQGGNWMFGDSNYSAFPDYITDLVSAQPDYDLDTIFDDTPLNIMGIEILDVDGNYQPIRPITLREIREKGFSQTNYLSDDGQPSEYEKRENIIVLYPAPDNGVSVTLTNGLKIFYLRTADVFTSGQVTTGTKEPGFPSPYHDIISYEVAYHYSIANGLPNTNFLKAELDRKEKELLAFISERGQDRRKVMTPKRINYI